MANEFGCFLTRQRQYMGLSQAAFAKKVGCSRSRWSAIERGEANMETTKNLLPNLSSVLGIEYAELLQKITLTQQVEK